MATNMAPTMVLDFARTKEVDPRITFTRASTACYYGADGLYRSAATNEPRIDHDPLTGECKGLLIEEARSNLLTYSENFDNAAWTKTQLTVAADTTMAPDGTTTADTLTLTATGDSYLMQAKVTSTDTTYSVFAKQGGASPSASVALRPITSATLTYDDPLYFNFATKVFTGNTGSFVGYGYIDYGGGWFRLWATKALQAGQNSSQMRFRPGGVTAVNGETAYFWGAQLEAGAFPTSYIPSNDTLTSRASTATYIGSDGLLKTAAIDEARMQYNPLNLALAPKLLLEGAGTNLAINSEVLSIGDGVSISADTAVSPSGATTADAMYEAATTGEHYCNDAVFAPTIGETYTWSAFVKNGNGTRNVYMRIAAGNIAVCVFDTTTGTIAPATGENAVSSAIVRLLNGWFRVSITFKATSSSTTVCRTQFITSAGATTYLGDTANFNYIWGRQLETGSYPTSYIPTTTTEITRAADVSTSTAATRAADLASMTGTNFSSWYRQDEGTFVVASATSNPIGVSSSAFAAFANSSNYHRVRHVAGTVDITSVSSGASQVDTNGVGVSVASFGVTAFAYKANDYAQSTLGSTPEVDVIATLPLSVTTLYLGSTDGSANNLNGHISRLAYFNARQDNATLRTLSAPQVGSVHPSLQLNFAKTKEVDPRITFTRASTACYYGADGLYRYAAVNEPRIDHDPITGACLGLLIEEARTNLLLNSAALVTQSIATTAAARTLSFYGTGTVVLSGTHSATVIGTGAFPARTTYTYTPTAGTLTLTVTGSALNANDELGAFATSWIPTTGASATRAADLASMTGTNFSSWYRQDEGAFVAGWNIPVGTGDGNQIVSAVKTGTSDVVSMRMGFSGTRRIRAFGQIAPGSFEYVTESAANAQTSGVTAMAFKSSNDFAASDSGATPVIDSSGAINPALHDKLLIGQLNINYLNGHISRLAYYPKRLSNSELQTLSTI